MCIRDRLGESRVPPPCSLVCTPASSVHRSPARVRGNRSNALGQQYRDVTSGGDVVCWAALVHLRELRYGTREGQHNVVAVSHAVVGRASYSGRHIYERQPRWALPVRRCLCRTGYRRTHLGMGRPGRSMGLL
eukprot:1992919-Prymnesium_polylepis.1